MAMFRKALFLGATIVLLGACSAWAGVVEFSWDPNTETDLAGYKLYHGTAPRTQAPYTSAVTINNRTATSWSLSLSPGTYYFALTAFDTSGHESGFSTEAMAVVEDPVTSPGKPGRPALFE
jgi:hypothetical protein